MTSSQRHVTPGQVLGTVAKVLTARELVVSIGSRNGVRKGMRFAVLAEIPEDIIDPESGEVLESLEREKIRVEAVDVRNAITICQTYQYRWIGDIDLARIFSNASSISFRRKVTETLRASDHAFLEPLSEDESLVKVGDPIKLLPSAPEEDEM